MPDNSRLLTGRELKLYLKLFLGCGIPIGIITAALTRIVFGVGGRLAFGLASGIIFGLFMSLILGTFHKFKTKKIVISKDVSVYQTRSIYLEISLDAAFDRCCEALRQIGAKTKSKDREQARIEAKTTINWKSWSEVIFIQLTDQNTGQVIVQISSSPRVRTTLVDYGKGYENVERIADLLSEVPDEHRP